MPGGDRATCVTAKLQDKLQEKLPSVTATSNDLGPLISGLGHSTQTCVKLKRLSVCISPSERSTEGGTGLQRTCIVT